MLHEDAVAIAGAPLARLNALTGEIMARKSRAATWSMKTDRELIQLAKSETLEAFADKLGRTPESILKSAARLRLSIKPKAKGK